MPHRFAERSQLNTYWPKFMGPCKHCEHSFKNHKDLKVQIGKTSNSLISARKEHRTSVSEELHLILTLLKLSSREEEEETSCCQKQSDLNEYKVKTYEYSEPNGAKATVKNLHNILIS